MKYDESLEEIWRIKREIAAEYPTLDDYFKGMMAYQEELKRQGVKFVRLPPKDGYPLPHPPSPLFIADPPAEYDAGAKPTAAPSSGSPASP